MSVAAVLIAAAIVPGTASGWTAASCGRPRCQTAGAVRWARPLPGSWIAQNGLSGTTPSQGQAYAALGGQVAAAGTGMTVAAYDAHTGRVLWAKDLGGFPAGSAIVSVRAWPGVVTVGVSLPPPTPPAPGTRHSKHRHNKHGHNKHGHKNGHGHRHARGAPASGSGTPAGTGTPSTGTPGGTGTPGSTGPGGAGTAAAAPGQGNLTREEVVLRAATGARLGVHPAAPFGGAVLAGPAATTIVGVHSVTSYSNRTGKTLWSRPTGPAEQAWQADGSHVYITVAAGGYLGAAPVTAVRRIDLRTGAERTVRPRGGRFTGSLGLAFGGAILFSDSSGVTAYSEITGSRLWHRTGALPDTEDASTHELYLISGDELVGVDPLTGAVLTRVTGAAAVSSSGLYAVRGGAVLGLDHGAFGKAWGFDVTTQRVLWTSRPLPWPHYFVDLSGIGGSASPAQDAVVLAICARLGAPLPANSGEQCARPELVALNR